MRTTRCPAFVLLIVLLATPAWTALAAQSTDSSRTPSAPAATPYVVTGDMVSHFAQVAPGIVKSAALARGNSAVVTGGAFMLPYMQQLAMEIERAGAVAVIMVTTDTLERFRITRTVAERMERPDALRKGMMTNADIWFFFAKVEDESMYAAMTAEQRSADARLDSLWLPVTTRRRGVYVVVPLPRAAAITGRSFDEYARNTWESMGADYTQLAKAGVAMRQRLAAARMIHVTSPEGTDLTFSIAKGTAFVDAGAANTFAPGMPRRVTLVPGGQIVAVVKEASANGKLRAAADFCKVAVKDEAIDIVKGRTTSVHAATDEACVRETMGSLHISTFTVGLNPTHPNTANDAGMSADFTSPGLVVIGFGGNQGIGGTNTEAAQWVVPLTRATVTADGATLVRDGKLVP